MLSTRAPATLAASTQTCACTLPYTHYYELVFSEKQRCGWWEGASQRLKDLAQHLPNAAYFQLQKAKAYHRRFGSNSTLCISSLAAHSLLKKSVFLNSNACSCTCEMYCLSHTNFNRWWMAILCRPIQSPWRYHVQVPVNTKENLTIVHHEFSHFHSF